jgi:predicted HTH transcriptional regulator
MTPPIYPLVEIKTIDNKKILIITISEGINKPYATSGSTGGSVAKTVANKTVVNMIIFLLY